MQLTPSLHLSILIPGPSSTHLQKSFSMTTPTVSQLIRTPLSQCRLCTGPLCPVRDLMQVSFLYYTLFIYYIIIRLGGQASEGVQGPNPIRYFFCTSSWRSSQLAFRRSTGNDVSGHYKHHYFLFSSPSSTFFIELVLVSKNLFRES